MNGWSRRLRGLPASMLGLLAAAVLITGCSGSTTQSSASAQALLREAFSHPIHSADIQIDLQLSAKGSSILRAPVAIELSGPYESNGAHKLPSFQQSFSVVGSPLSGQLTSTGNDVYITLGGKSYDVGSPQIAKINQQLASSSASGRPRLAVHPASWVTSAQNQGAANIDGTETTHVRAGLNVGRMLEDIDRALTAAHVSLPSKAASHGLSQQQIHQIESVVHNPTFDVYVAKPDGTLRRLAVALTFSVPKASAASLGGATGGYFDFSIQFSNIGQPVSIQAPANPQPLRALKAQLQGSFGGGLVPSVP